MKDIEFLGDSLDALRSFPERARRAAGFQLDRLQRGLEPLDWKPMTSIGPGVQEIRVREGEPHCGERRDMGESQRDERRGMDDPAGP